MTILNGEQAGDSGLDDSLHQRQHIIGVGGAAAFGGALGSGSPATSSRHWC